LKLEGDPFQAGDDNRVSVWAEFLVPESAVPLASYDHPFFGKYPAITRNQYGKGTVTYEGTVVSDRLQEKVVADVLKKAGLYGPDQTLPEAVRYKAGIGNAERPIRYYLNYSDQARTFSYPHESGTELLTQKPIARLQNLTLSPWGVVIVEEK
jgi:beta-galactosidase